MSNIYEAIISQHYVQLANCPNNAQQGVVNFGDNNCYVSYVSQNFY